MTMVRLLWRSVVPVALLVAISGCGGEIDQTALRAEIGSAQVVLLSTASCGYCRKLRGDLEDWDVSYDELDVETSDAGQRAYYLVGGRGVPILLVGDQVVHGYSPQRARELLGAAGISTSSLE